MSGYWSVVRSKPNRERWAAQNIERQGLECYLPMLAERDLLHGKVTERTCCLFPGYVFVRIGDRWLSLLGTFGVSKIVMGSEGKPARIPDSVITTLKEQHDDDGLIRLGQGPMHLRVGMQVRVTEGTMAEYTGTIFAGMDARGRVKVLLEILGAKRAVTISSDHLEAI